MKIIKATFAAGEEIPFNLVGRYFRVISGDNDVRLKIPEKGIDSLFKVGLGATFSLFSLIRIKSETAQTIEFVVSKEKIDDSRLTGDVDINGLLSVVNAGGSSYSTPATTALVAGVASEVVALDATRIKASIQCDVDMWIGADNTVTSLNGIRVGRDNLLSIDNTAALWAVTIAAGTVRHLEEFI